MKSYKISQEVHQHRDYTANNQEIINKTDDNGNADMPVSNIDSYKSRLNGEPSRITGRIPEILN